MSASKLALLGGTPTGSVSSGQHPRFSQDAVDRIVELLKRGVTVGLNKNSQEIAEAEEAIAEWQGVKYCLHFVHTPQQRDPRIRRRGSGNRPAGPCVC